MSSLDTVENTHAPYNSYFFIAILLCIAAGCALAYVAVEWYEEIITEDAGANERYRTLQQAFRYKQFTCSSAVYKNDLLLRKITPDFAALEKTYVPDDLVQIPAQYRHPRVGIQQVRDDVLPSVVALIDSARAEGIDMRVNSAYRSYSRQQQIYASEYELITVPEKAARPGHSEHQLGAAVDLSQYPGSPKRGYDWLAANAHKYGFALSYREGAEDVTSYRYEPWHWRYVGDELATYIHENTILFNHEKALLLPSPISERTELPYDYEGRDLWVWKSLENAGRFETTITGVSDQDYFADIPDLLQKMEGGYFAAEESSFSLSIRDWIVEKPTENYQDAKGLLWQRTGFASPLEGYDTERIEVLYRENLGYLVVNHQSQSQSGRVVKDVTSMCGFGK